jgi:type II secretory ATPase GspE/PulE/Tfp pilus assembly ATPase PilB-like protein
LPQSESEVPKLKEDLGFDTLPLANQKAYTLYKGKGCPECTNGYKGRVGIYEVFSMSDAMEKLLAQHATTSQIQAQAEADGMVTMKQDGYLKALNGLTTLEEVARVASDF